MKRRFIITLFFLFSLIQISYGQQDFKKQFKALFDKNDVAGQEKLLQNWEKSRPDDPELYVSYFNFYLNKSRREVVSLNSVPTSEDSIRMTKTDDEKVVAYLGSATKYEKADFDKAIEYLDKGIEKFPNRLDMRFGKIAAFRKIENYRIFTDEIVKAIDYSNVNKNQWLWTNDESVKEPKKVFLSSLQDYFVQVYDSGDENIEYLKTIAENVLKYYPDSVENLSNLAIYYMLKKDYENALTHLLKAEKLAPADPVIVGNIAWTYYLKGDKVNSLKYYELLKKYGDDQQKMQADEKITELKKAN